MLNDVAPARLWNALHLLESSFGSAGGSRTSARVRALERRLAALLNPALKPEARARRRGSSCISRHFDAISRPGGPSTSTAGAGPRDPLMHDVLDFFDFAASTTRIAAATRDQPRIRVVDITLEKIRRGL